MAQSGKITELVDVKAYQDWLKMVEAVETGEKAMRQATIAALELTKATGSGTPKETIQNTQKLAKATDLVVETQNQQIRQQNELVKAEAKLNAATKLYAGSQKELSANIDYLTKKRERLSGAAKEEEQRTNALKKQIDELNETYKKNATAAQAQAKNIGNYKSAVEGLKGQLMKLGGVMAAAFSVTAITAFFKSGYEGIEKQIIAERRLLVALDGRRFAQQQLVKQAAELQDKTGIDDDTIVSVQALAAEHGLTTEEIKKATQAAIAYSAVTGKDLNDAAKELFGTLEGKLGRTLPKLSIEFTDLTNTQLQNGAAIDLVIQKYGAYTETAITASGKLKNAWGEFQETITRSAFGEFITRALTDTSKFINLIGKGVEKGRDGVRDAALRQNDLNVLLNKQNNLRKQQKDLQQQIDATTSKGARGEDLKTKKIQEYNAVMVHLNAVSKEIVRRQGEQLDAGIKTVVVEEKKTKQTKDLKDALKDKNKVQEKEISIYTWLKLKQEEQAIATTDYTAAANDLVPVVEELFDEYAKLAQFEEADMPWAASSRKLIDDETESLKKQKEELKNLRESLKELGIDTAGDILTNIIGENYDQRIQEVTDSLESWHALQLQNIEERKNKGLISDKEYQKQKEKLEADYEKKQKEAKTKAAKIEKEAALWEIAINTAVAIAKAAPNVLLMALAAATGAGQAAIVASKPIPKFAKGTQNAPEGFAIVGERGSEMVIDNGRAYMTPSTDTLTYLSKGSKVIPHDEVMQMAEAMGNPAIPKMTDKGFGYDITEIMNNVSGRIVSAIKNKQETHINITEAGMRKITRSANGWTEYINKNIRH